jgi:hypothetical protein
VPILIAALVRSLSWSDEFEGPFRAAGRSEGADFPHQSERDALGQAETEAGRNDRKPPSGSLFSPPRPLLLSETAFPAAASRH